MYKQLFQLTFELFKVARKDGLLGLEVHLSKPHSSEIFIKYPLITNNHHICHFLCDGLTPLVDGVAYDQLAKYMEAEMKTIEEEHHAALNVLNRVCDSLPGFGIVAAVLGIVVTMAHIDGPVQEIGHKVGAALVGTFLGILASYGFMSPVAGRMEAMGHEEMAFFKTISIILVSFAETAKPKESLELARRGVSSEYRPSIAELEVLLKDVGSAEA
jgi:chemotaxis protein MotA